MANERDSDVSRHTAGNDSNNKEMPLVFQDTCSPFSLGLLKRPHKEDGFPLRSQKSLPLWERILAWCQYAKWYNADIFQEDYYAEYAHEHGISQTCTLLYSPSSGFAFPPATEEALLQVEERLGFAHPSVLRDLYLHIANGGFGPGYGLIGIPGGFFYGYSSDQDPRYAEGEKEKLMKEYGKAFCEETWPALFTPIWFDVELHERVHHDPKLIRLVRGEWPLYFLYLCGTFVFG